MLASQVAHWYIICLPVRDTLDLGWEHPLEEQMATHSIFLPAKFRGQRSLEGYSPWGCKESDIIARVRIRTPHRHTLSYISNNL